MNGQIFISYRRDDTSAWAGRLCDRLSNQFPSNQIFMDVDSVDLGEDFVKTIEKTVASCDVLIAVIGKGWLTSRDREGERRLDKTEDFVRIEIATALKRDIRVIPVLVDGASMPLRSDLPDDLQALVRRNALQLSHERFHTDSERLASAVGRALEKTAVERREPQETERLKTEYGERKEKELLEAEDHLRLEKERLEAERSGDRQESERRQAEQRQTERRQREQQRLRVEQRVKESERPEGERLRKVAWILVALALVLAIILIGSTISRVRRSSPNLLTSSSSSSFVPSPPASHARQSGEQPASLLSPGGMSQRETRVAGVTAELSRFVRAGNLITAEVKLQNTNSVPTKFSCDDWQLIDEQTGVKSGSTADGGRVSSSFPETLAPGETHVAWAKFKTEPGDLSGNKYSINIESILNRPFEGLALKSPQ